MKTITVITEDNEIRCEERFRIPEKWMWMIENLTRILGRISSGDEHIGCDPEIEQ